MTEKETQKKLNRLAKEFEYDYAKRHGVYKGCEVWSLETNEYACVGYPIFVLVKNNMANVVTVKDKRHSDVWNFVNSCYSNEDENEE